MTEIIPAILAKDSAELEQKLANLPTIFDFVEIDVVESEIFADPMPDFQVHFMSDYRPHLSDWLSAGAKRLITHKLDSELLTLRPGVELGLAVELTKPLDEIYPLISQIDFLQLMSIERIGAQGRKFDERIFARINEVKEKFPEAVIAVDGGVNLENAEALIEAGAERLVVGSAIFESESPIETFEQFLELI